MGHNRLHASEHTDGITDDIQNASNSQKGLATAAQIINLENAKAVTDGYDSIEHFHQRTDYLPETGAAEKIYNNTFAIIEGTPSKHNASTLKMTAAAEGSAEIEGLVTINPAIHTYLEFRWKYKQDTVSILELAHELVISDIGGENFFSLATDDASNIEIAIENGVTSDDAVIVHNLTANTEFCLKIKSGEIQFLINDVLKKSFTGDGLWYDIDSGIKYYIGISNPDTSEHYFLLDYAKILTGRPF